MFFGDLEGQSFEGIRDVADQNLVLYATGGTRRAVAGVGLQPLRLLGGQPAGNERGGVLLGPGVVGHDSPVSVVEAGAEVGRQPVAEHL